MKNDANELRRKQRNKEICNCLKRGDEMVSDQRPNYSFTPYKKIEKDKDAIARLYPEGK